MAKKTQDEEKPTRRGFLTKAAVLGGGLAAGVGVSKVLAPPASAAATTTPKTHDEILDALIKGNERWAKGSPIHPNVDAVVRAKQAEKETPFAAVVTCSDSRVSPELIFDQGIGDLFAVRVAGNIASPDVVASLAYAVEHLGVTFIVVLGHEACGAVKATVETVEKGTDAGELIPLIDAIRPAVVAASGKVGADTSTLLDTAISTNAQQVAKRLPDLSRILEDKHVAKDLEIKSAVYSVTTSWVSFLD